jgi:hypothetical protein
LRLLRARTKTRACSICKAVSSRFRSCPGDIASAQRNANTCARYCPTCCCSNASSSVPRAMSFLRMATEWEMYLAMPCRLRNLLSHPVESGAPAPCRSAATCKKRVGDRAMPPSLHLSTSATRSNSSSCERAGERPAPRARKRLGKVSASANTCARCAAHCLRVSGFTPNVLPTSSSASFLDIVVGHLSNSHSSCFFCSKV